MVEIEKADQLRVYETARSKRSRREGTRRWTKNALVSSFTTRGGLFAFDEASEVVAGGAEGSIWLLEGFEKKVGRGGSGWREGAES